MVPPLFLFLACAAALPRIEPAGKVDLKASYSEERAVFLLFLLLYSVGNWSLTLSGLNPSVPTDVAIHRLLFSASLVIALVGRSRRLDWLAVAIIGASFAVRLATQMAR